MLLSATTFLTELETLSRHGYDAMDVCFTRVIYNDGPYPHDPSLDSEDYEKVLDEYIAESKRLGIKFVTSHLPYRFSYTDPTSEKFDFCHKMTLRSLKASEYLGVEWAVMHVKSVEGTVEYAKRLFAESGVKKVGIAIENSAKLPIDELIEAVDILAEQGYKVGICLDVGHCHINQYHDNDIPEVIAKMGKRLKMLHLHDNCRTADHHRAPYMGTIKWEEVMKALKDAEYCGDFNLEVSFDRMPKAALDGYHTYAVAISRYLIDVFDKA